MKPARGEVRIGISGWRYAPWRGVFYPEELPQRAELEFAAQRFRSIEINGTFYSLQRPEYFRAWRDATPDGFVFAVKGGRYITHLRRLKEIETPLANFFASGVLCLERALGPFLWQFPQQFRFDSARFEAFFRLLPRDTRAAARLAKRCDERLAERGECAVRGNRRLRHAIEVRHTSFATHEFVALCREHDVAIVVADTAGKWPYIEDVTSDFMYLRLHGDEELYRSGYTDTALERWKRRIAAWASGREPRDAVRVSGRAPAHAARDVFVYFDNDIKVHAPFDAMSLARRLGADRGTALEGEALPPRSVTKPLRREQRGNPWRELGRARR